MPWREKDISRPFIAGVHLVTYEARPGRPAVSSPDLLHCDGEPFTFIHLVERRNVEGGANMIAPRAFEKKRPDEVPPEAVLAELTLESPLDTIAVNDAKVAHYVSRVQTVPGADRGWRSVILVDFSILAPAQYARRAPAESVLAVA